MHPKDNRNRKKPNPVRGHDALLFALRKNEEPLTLIDINREEFTGKVANYDAFTITLKLKDNPKPVTFFKGSLLRFYPA